METKVQTSFIPKKPLNSGDTRRVGFGFFSLIALIIFIASIGFAGGVVLYKKSIETSIKNNKATLEKSKAAFDPDFIKAIVRLNSRMDIAKKLLTDHVAVTPIFEILEKYTLAAVSFNDFKFERKANGDVLISMRGTAKNYNSIALQSDLFGKSSYVHDALFENLNLDSTGNIGFTFSAMVDPKIVKFNEALNRTISGPTIDESVAPASAPTPTTPAPQAPASTPIAPSTVPNPDNI